MTVTAYFLVAGTLLLMSVLISKASERFGVPAMLFFLAIGMLAGSDGLGKIHFDNPRWAQMAGTVALAFILFAGGLETQWANVRPVLSSGLRLSTLGVVVTAGLTGAFVTWLLNVPWPQGLLIGAIVSSTDAAAVFSVLKSKNIRLKGSLKPLLELESGSNDPMAVFLTVSLVKGLSGAPSEPLLWVGSFVLQMGLGFLIGYGGGAGTRTLLNRVALSYEGLYPALTLSAVLLVFGAAEALGGNGFLAVYIAGIVLGNSNFLHRRSLGRFHDGLAWLMQIGMFLTLGLLVFPSRLPAVALPGLAVAAFLMFLARPLAVFLSLWGTRATTAEKWLVSWVGLRGAVPIVLATFPLMAGLPGSDNTFNIVFFIVLTSALIQGVSFPTVAGWLKLESALEPKPRTPFWLNASLTQGTQLLDFILPYDSPKIGNTLVSLNMPKDSLIALVGRGDGFIVPDGKTTLEPGDVLWVLVSEKSLPRVRELFTETAPPAEG